MSLQTFPWKKIFLFCSGLFLASAFCMKWMEGDLVQDGSLFTIVGLEVSYPAEKISALLASLDPPVRSILRYHLSFDFVFMAGVYPGIASLCMLARQKWAGRRVSSLLGGLALLQLVAWGCDIAENVLLLKWTAEPGSVSSFGLYHTLVYVKWLIALIGVLTAITFLLIRRVRSSPTIQ
ncbi:MAG: hypothetical protein NTW29_07605 [Bacteroidetes bacterium]|nr:hypothetical protein [Bacteroidota bacterium]